MAAFRLLRSIERKCLFSSSLRPLLCASRLVSSKPVAERISSTNWPDDGLDLGSYPNLPHISAQTKEPCGWWDIQERRNYGDTVHEEDDALNVWMYDAPEKSLYPPHVALRHLMTAFALLGGFVYVGYLYGKTKQGNRNDYTPKQFPYNENHIIYKDGDPKQRLKL